MELIPVEIVCKILKKLDLNDILICSQVSRKWNSIIKNNIRIDSLAVKDKDQFFTSKDYFFKNESIDKSFFFDTKNQDFFQSKLIRPLLKNLKQLYIQLPSLYYESTFDISKNLNQFTKLELLQIGCLKTNKPFTLSLPNLKILSLIEIDGVKVKLDLPKLKIFENYYNLENFEFVNYNTLTHLFTELYEEDVKKFQNLEYYYCENLSSDMDYNENNLPKDLLTLLPKLKELHCSKLAKKDILSNILSSKNKLRRLDFKLFYNGIYIENLNELNKYPTYVEDNCTFLFNIIDNFQIIIDNYTKLSDYVYYVNQINYSSLIKNEIDLTKFASKFVKIEKIIVDEQITDKQQFIEFIKKCNFATFLELKNTSLDQSFYNQLHIYLPHIDQLEIIDNIKLNLNFLIKLNELKHFKINQKVNFNIISRTFNQLKNFYQFSFLIKKNKFCQIQLLGNYWSRINLLRTNKYTNLSRKPKTKFVRFKNRNDLLDGLKIVLNNCK